ncbi:S-layer homology domain-containing protein [Tumebacillus sp. ITR2]|uniref:S-layer homology domain-containing protein n=1 Tax=Tumebacillus amylolyticus TaxID=2801339 RepID=A0ABS1JGT1_9BACL|nr:S-layer homology domain-containing protein [Tumebacillus amylolyticus]MBL0389500.1 S-layer homology domain-containing protein [Tumebacillus amylolyticus]
MNISNKLIASTIVLSAMFNPVTVLAATGDSAVTTSGSTDAIQQAKELGLLVGDPNGDFRPGDAVSRAELAKLLCTMFKLQVDSAKTSSFTDVTATDWGVAYIEAVHKAGLMQGDGQSFRPNETITREEMAVVLVHALGVDAQGKGDQLSNEDKAVTSHWAQDAVQAVQELGFMKFGGTKLPQQPLNRQEIATVVVGVVDRPVGDIQVTNGTLKIAGLTYEVSPELQGLLNANNTDALKGAKLNFNRDGFKITELKRLELNAADGTLDAQNATLSGDVVVNAPMTLKNLNANGKLQVQSASVNVENTSLASVDLAGQDVQFHVTGKSHVGALVVQNKASITTDADAFVEQLQLGDKSTDVELKGYVKHLVISEGTHAKITLAEGAKIDSVTAPTEVKLKDYIVDYDKVKANIPMVNNGVNQDVLVVNTAPQNQTVDKTALTAKLTEAMTLSLETQVGTDAGQVPQSAMDALIAAMAAAQAVKDKTDTTQTEVDTAIAALQQAITDFKASIVVDPSALTISLKQGAEFPLNSALSGGDGDVFLTDDSGMVMFAEGSFYNKRNIKKLLQVKRGAMEETLRFNTNTHNFDVFDADNTQVGVVEVDSVSNDLDVSQTGSGFTIHPKDSVTEGTSATIHFTLEQGGSKVGEVDLPITFDETAPTWSGMYSNSAIQLTSSEKITTVTSFPVPMESVKVEYSQLGDYSDVVGVPVISGFTVGFTGNVLTLTLNPDWLSAAVQAGPGSKFRITTTGYYDLAKNEPSNKVVEVNVSHF